jgi:phenylpropionate dioxygenase-like ring-hydroxylating dioxygenase large terminal subunit
MTPRVLVKPLLVNDALHARICPALCHNDRMSSLLENAWYCAAWSHEIPNLEVLGRKVLDRHVVLFRDSGGRIHALAAVCPHRGADLSRGRVVDDTLQCPLHGWRFDARGKCIAIPSQPASLRISSSSQVPSYLVSENQGIIWIWVGPHRESVPKPPEHDVWQERGDRRRHFNRPALWRCTFGNAVENAIDTTHVPFVHTRTLGLSQRRLYPRQTIVVDDDLRGFSGEDSSDNEWGSGREVDIIGGIPGRLAARLLGMGMIRRERYRFDLGGSLFYEIQWSSGAWDVLVVHSTPADERHTWVFAVTIRTRATHFLGNVAQRWFNRALMREDEVAVTTMLSNDASLLPSPVSVIGDEPLLAFQRIYAHHLSQQQASE